MSTPKTSTVEEYIQRAPIVAQPHLATIRAILRNVAPEAQEVIKWGMPALQSKRIIFSYGAFKNHINFIPTGPSLLPFKEALSSFTVGKDTIQFPYNQELPYDLICRIAEHRVKDLEENDAKWMYKKAGVK